MPGLRATARTVHFDVFVESGTGLGSAMKTHRSGGITQRTYNPRDGHEDSML